RTTRVSNPVRSPSFRASASDASQDTAFAFGIPPDIYAFHHSTRNSMSLSGPQVQQFSKSLPSEAGYCHSKLTAPPARPLRPVTPDNARPLRITAAAGTKLAGASSAGTVIIVPAERALQPEGL